jgi:hypothetical protein
MKLCFGRSSLKSKNTSNIKDLRVLPMDLPAWVTRERLISLSFFNLEGIREGELIHSKVKNTQSEETLSSKNFFGTPATILDSFGGFACEGGD